MLNGLITMTFCHRTSPFIYQGILRRFSNSERNLSEKDTAINRYKLIPIGPRGKSVSRITFCLNSKLTKTICPINFLKLAWSRIDVEVLLVIILGLGGLKV